MRYHALLAAGFLVAGGLALADVTHESFDAADSNSDGKITKDEFYGFVSDAGIYADYDYDSNGFIDENEFGDMDVGEDFNDWDLDDDSYLSDNELYDGYFDYYDDDADGDWDTTEWDDAGETGLFDV